MSSDLPAPVDRRSRAGGLLLALGGVLLAALLLLLALHEGRREERAVGDGDGGELSQDAPATRANGGSQPANVTRSAKERGRAAPAGPASTIVYGPSASTRAVARLVDIEDDHPVAGVRVEFFARHLYRDLWKAETLLARKPLAVAESDAGGLVYLPRNADGFFFLDAAGPEYHSVDFLRLELHPDIERSPITVRVARGGRVHGVVRDAYLRPLSAGRVIAIPGLAAMLAALRGGHLTLRTSAIAADGSYALGGIPAGRGWRVAALEGCFTPAASAPFTLAAGDDLLVDVRTAPARRLRGEVVDGAGRPVADALVEFATRAPGGLLAADLLSLYARPHQSARTDTGGRFELAGVPAAAIRLWASHPAYAPGEVRTLDARAAPTDSIRLVLRRGLGLRGLVVDAAGRGIPAASISCLGKARASRRPPPSRRARTLSDSEGRFELAIDERLAKGPSATVELLLERKGYAARIAPVALPAPAPLRLELHPGRALEGLVLDAASEEPLHDFTLEIDSAAPLRKLGRAVRNRATIPFHTSDGRFRSAALFGGKIEVRVLAAGYESATRTIDLEQPAEQTQIFRLAPAALLVGEVVATGGAPVAEAIIQAGGWREPGPLRMVQQRDGPATRSDEQGRFRLAGVRRSEDRYLHAQREGFLPLRNLRITWSAQQTPAPMHLVLRRGGGVHGRVSDAAGNPLADRMVLCFAARGGSALRSCSSGPAGGYAFEDLDPKLSYSLAVLAPQAELRMRAVLSAIKANHVRVRAGESIEVNLVAGAAGNASIRGRVSTSDGSPVEEGVVFLAVERPESTSPFGLEGSQYRRCDAAGRFAIEDLAAGRYTLAFGELGATDPSSRRCGRRVIDLAPGAALELELVIAATRLRGIVTDASTGSPLEKITVQLEKLSGAGSAGERNPFLFRALVSRQSDEQGVFIFPAVEPGSYRLRARAPRGAAGERGYAEALLEPLVIRAGEGPREVHLALSAEARLDLRVLAARTAEPVAGALVYIDRGGKIASDPRGQTGAGGRLQLGGLRAGAARLVVQARGYREGGAELNLLAGATQELSVSLIPGATLRVRVLDESSRPVPGARVLIRASGGAARPARRGALWRSGWLGDNMLSDTHGAMATTLLEPGSYTISARKGELAAPRESVVIPPSGEVAIELHLRR